MFLTLCSAYRGSKIEWDNDECAASLINPEKPAKITTAAKAKDTSLMNRFQLLDVDESEDVSDSDDDHDTSGITLQSTFSPSTINV